MLRQSNYVAAFVAVLLGLAGTRTAAPSPRLAGTPAGATGLASSTTGLSGLHVSGNQLVDSSGARVRLLGVNRSGTEYACVQGWGIFDGPSDATSVQATASWHANAVRVPLNEDCWLGINGVPSAYSGANYQSAIVSYVGQLNAAGLYAILDLHWSAPGTHAATAQAAMPDQDHSPAFWTSVATTFKGNPDVVFDLFNEPFPAQDGAADPWGCWRNGCQLADGFGTWQAAGLQSLLTAVRQAGAAQPVLAGGIAWSNDLSGWLAHEPSDPAGALVAAWHSYPANACNTQSCWDQQVAPVAQQVPVVTGEVGDSVCSAATYVSTLLPYLDSHGISYLGWTWDTWNQCSNVLITSYSGTPSANFGQYYHDHLAGLAPSPSPLPRPYCTRKGCH